LVLSLSLSKGTEGGAERRKETYGRRRREKKSGEQEKSESVRLKKEKEKEEEQPHSPSMLIS